ncbi:MAG: amidohydrolase [Bacteroidetes bacterium]|nr:amidohydrolase [Bacteroidota bacterium]
MKILLQNAKIWLGKKYFASSVGIDDETGKIIFAGSGDDAVNKYDAKYNLKGKFIMPAFSDGHVHLFKGALVSSEVDLRYAGAVSEFRDKILGYKSGLKTGGWIVGGYYSETNFRENFAVDKSLLDGICADTPVLLFRTDLHSVVCNSAALNIIRIENKRGDFHSDELITDSKGNITGELKERAMYYAMKFIPEKSPEEKKKILEDEINRLHRQGITSVTDISWREDLDVYKTMYSKNKLELRINSVIPFNELDKIYSYKEEFRLYAGLIRFGGFKAFYDGSLSSKAALFYDNYKGSDYRGLRTEMVVNNEFRELGERIDRAGFQIVVHAIGDRAVSEVLDFAEYLYDVNGSKNRRFRIEHAQHIAESDIERFAKSGIIASVQPAHIFFDAKVADEFLVHPETTHVFRKLSDRGVRLCFGTDFPVVPVNPFHNIYYAMTRKANGFPDGFMTEYALDLTTCLEAYTLNNAYASYTERTAGSVAEGKNADLIMLDRNPFESAPEEIKNTVVETTFLNGKIVYGSL